MNIVSDKLARESAMMRVSIRAWLALLVVGTVCVLSLYQVEVSEPLRSMALIALGYFFSKVPDTKPIATITTTT